MHGFSALRTLDEIPAAAWDALVDGNDPFLEHAFLRALERSGSVGEGTGWEPRFVVARRQERLVGAVPLYLKEHSYGEFVFDWGWANGAQRAGIRYYPKLVAAVPFTPVTGARLLVHPEADRDEVTATLLEGVRDVAERERVSSVHMLFCTEAETRALEGAGYLPRLGMQFHWENRDPPYRDFDDYLSEMRSRNRKQVRKERAGAAEGLRLVTLTGPELGDVEWTALRRFYLANARKHGGAPYLTAGFFELARATFPERVVAALAYKGDRPIAGTLNFERGRHLYGRYWGCAEEHEFLHFELGYYRLIERAIAAGHTRFEAGAQGEHKLKRGLLPRPTYSAHLMLHPDLHRAVARFLRDEAEVVRGEMAAYDAASPFRRGGD